MCLKVSVPEQSGAEGALVVFRLCKANQLGLLQSDAEYQYHWHAKE